MIDARFDDLSRFLARASGSRRRFVGGLIASGGLAAIGQDAEAKKAGKPDKLKDVSNKAKPDKSENVKSAAKCASEGHPCEGNQVCCEGLVCGTSGQGSARRCGNAASSTTRTQTTAVAPIPAYVVNVSCSRDANADQSTCLATCEAPAGATAVRSVAVASSAVCADVVGGDAALGTPGPAVGSTGFTSANGQATLKLVLTGTVTVGGIATYWCLTDAGTVPAQGPGLVRVQDDVSDSTGAVEVRVAACPIGRPGPANYDWHGQCSHTVPGAAFVLASADGLGGKVNANASADGWARFGKLAPGAYQLTQTDGAWCHAESDGVDASGRVIVKAGQRTTVWIFECQSASGN